jgi:MFS superfamily sulfate permease-like transporter
MVASRCGRLFFFNELFIIISLFGISAEEGLSRADIVAGVSVAGLMLPEAVAYSGIAGLPPERALLAAIVGCIVYAVFGRSRFAVVSPTSSSAAVLAASLAALQGPLADKLFLATVLVATAGLVFLLMSLLQLGALAALISRPVLGGFAFGLAITIVLHQLPLITGVAAPGGNIFAFVHGLLADAQHWHMASIATGATALAALLVLRRWRAVPGSFLILGGGIGASWFFDLPSHGVAVVGAIPLSLSMPQIPAGGLAETIRLLPYAFPIVLILLAESWGTIRSLALRHGDAVQPNRELGALGAANLASALVQGMPVGAGFSGGAASEAAGTESRWAAVVAAVALALLVLSAGGLVARLPEPVLAAVVIAALMHALNPAPLYRLWRLGQDQYVALAATASVLFLGILDGLLIAVLLSFAIFIRRLAVAHVARLGRLGSSHTFVDVERHDDAQEIAGIAIWRPSQPLFFGNAESMLGRIAAMARAEQNIHAIVISLEETFEIDTTALDAIIEFDTAITRTGVQVLYARMHDRVRDLLRAARADAIVARSRFSVDDAVLSITGSTAKPASAS